MDPVLEEAFRRVLMQADKLDPAEQQAVLEKAQMLLSRFRKSEAFSIIGSAEERRHEIPFSFAKGNFTVNGVIDLLMKEKTGRFVIIDFKTDALKDMDGLKQAVEDHSRQLESYRQAVSTTLGAEPDCMICFLDFCGKVILEPVGKGPLLSDDGEPDALPEDPSEDDFFFAEYPDYSDGFPPEI